MGYRWKPKGYHTFYDKNTLGTLELRRYDTGSFQSLLTGLEILGFFPKVSDRVKNSKYRCRPLLLS